MATATVSNDESDTNAYDDHLEIFSLVWLDANVNLKDSRDTQQNLRTIINHLKKFQDPQKCQQYIEQRSKKDRLVLIVSGLMGREFIPVIHTLPQVSSIYVYCNDKESNEQWACQFAKVKAVVVEIDELVSRIEADYKIQKKVEQPLSISMLNTGKSTTEVDGQFVFSQVLIDCLLRMQSNQRDKNELILRCTSEYEGNDFELGNLFRFQQDYSSDRALWWYTRESFFYKTLNTALRCQNIHMLFLYRSFISDMYLQLQQRQSNIPLLVYRSQLMPSDELEDLKRCIGQLISVNSFLSTSSQRSTALFLLGDTTQPTDLERVLFEINADPKVSTTKPFADISMCSKFPDESEVLFMIGSIFRLNNISRGDNQVWTIRMTLCGDDEHDLKHVLAYMTRQNGSGPTNLRTLARVLWQMGKLDLAEKYYSLLLTELPQNDPLLSTIYEDLGQIASQKGDFNKSIQWRQKVLVIEQQHLSAGNANTGGTSNSNSQTNTSRKVTWTHDGITVAGGNQKGNALNQLFYPWGLHVDDDQILYIADCVNDRIVEWKCNATSGQVVAGGQGEGNKTNQLNGPRDVIVDKQTDSLIICDSRNRRVVRWPRQGGVSGQAIISNINCFGLAMSDDGFLYVSDFEKDEVRRWRVGETSGTVIAGANGKGDRLDQLSSPTFIFVDQNHSIYVSDFNNHRVMKWMEGAKEGIIVAGGHGQGNAFTQLNFPQGVSVDQFGTVYVADNENLRIMRWPKDASQGSIVVGANGEGNQADQLNRPLGLSFDRSGNLYVVDHWNHRVQRFSLDVRT